MFIVLKACTGPKRLFGNKHGKTMAQRMRRPNALNPQDLLLCFPHQPTINQNLTRWAAGVLLYQRLPAPRWIAFTTAKEPHLPHWYR